MSDGWATPAEVKGLLTLREFAEYPHMGGGVLKVHDDMRCAVLYYAGTPYEKRRYYPYGRVPGCVYDGYRHYVVNRRKVMDAAR